MSKTDTTPDEKCPPCVIDYALGGQGFYCVKCGEKPPSGWTLDEALYSEVP